MDFASTYLVIGILVSLLILIYTLRSRIRGGNFFAISCFLSILWMYAELIKRTDQTLQIQWQAETPRFIAAIALPVFSFLFISNYLGKNIGLKKTVLLFVVPSISTIMLLTNDNHLLFFKQSYLDSQEHLRFTYGLYYWLVHLPYSYTLLMITLVLILDQLRKTPKEERKRLKTLFAAVLIPFIANALSVFKVFGDISLTAFSLPLFFLTVSFAIFRYNFLRASPLAYEKVFSSISDGVLVVDTNNRIIDINPAAAEGLGKTVEELVGKKLEEVFSEWSDLLSKCKDAENFYDEFQINLHGEQRYISVKVSPVKSKADVLEGRVFILRDITESKRYEFFLRNLAFRDSLTHTANRRKFQEDFELLIERSRVLRRIFSVIYFDIDDFKNVNDCFGHNVGDELLKLVAARVASVLRGPDTVARLGGDEFAVLLHECGEESAKKVVSRICKAVEEPFLISGKSIKVSISCGLAVYPKDGLSMKELLEVADLRMYEEKNKKKAFPKTRKVK
ncbi:MAG: diguanylate cyclase [Acidobacteria bacterium]|jgi:diguanylate cyclase (GGDEF)-like protein/PAS domain S-box-containing protein|nr:MAG: diguanylate cyclase [Acidobacteriota bacterium]GIU81539.1 MAG: hypothetical protein KatS3mg006_0603 [Pyrinomonadaceae bacterium]